MSERNIDAVRYEVVPGASDFYTNTGLTCLYDEYGICFPVHIV